jgi:hypothetical protein
MWRDGAMTEPTSPLQSLCDHVAVLAQSREADRLAARIAPSTTSGDLDLIDLLARRDADGGPAIVVQERLAVLAPDDPLAALALLSMLAGDLEVMSVRLAHSGLVEPADAEAEVLAVAWELVTRRPPPGRWERRDVIWAAARRSTGMRRRRRLEFVALPDGFEPVVRDDDRLERWPGLLATAVAAGVLTPRQVVLIARTRMEGRPLREVAQALGRPFDAAYKERRRAETALRTFLLRYDSGDPS